jgi:uncharacterized membrane-anchored protein
MPTQIEHSTTRMLNKVPQVTLIFWIVKMMSTSVGETAADFLASDMEMGIAITTVLTGLLLVAALAAQFRTRRYTPSVYWLSVVSISTVGTLITDALVDLYGVALTTTSAAFGLALMAVFALWYASERTLSIHSIHTMRRECFYWLAILFTFALGTAAGDLVAEGLDLGYATSALIYGSLIALVALAFWLRKLNAVFAFWVAYVLTRPFGASIGDYLSQPAENGGLGLGTVWTSVVFLTAILAAVGYMTFTRFDAIEASEEGLRA